MLDSLWVYVHAYMLYIHYIYAKECFEIDWQQRQIQRAKGNYLDDICLIQALVIDQVIINPSCLLFTIRQPDASKGTTRKKEKREKQKPKKDEEEEEDGGGWEEVKGGAAAHSAKGVGWGKNFQKGVPYPRNLTMTEWSTVASGFLNKIIIIMKMCYKLSLNVLVTGPRKYCQS